MPMFIDMTAGKIKGFLLMGQNPAVGGQNARLQRKALAKLDWMVVRDFFETETAAFWRNSPEIRSGELKTSEIKTEVFFLPAAVVAEMEGTFTNTKRLIQAHDKAVDPPGDARSDAWFSFLLGKRLKELYKDSANDRDWAIRNLLWNYEPDAAESAEWRIKDEPSACGAWIYTGVIPEEGKNRGKSRKGDEWISPNWGFAWPANRHIMYNRASAEGIDFQPTKAPGFRGKDNALGFDWLGGSDAFIMRSDGKAWLFAPAGLVDGPLPAHYEPYESPVKNLLYQQQSNPVAKVWNVEGNPYHKVADPSYPIVLSTYRLTEHHLSGVMSRWLPWLAELMPELFCEISPELAAERGIRNGEYATIRTSRGEVEARALVTRRMRPFLVDGKTVHEIGLPWHWGWQGTAQGDVVNNLTPLVGDPNVSIHEGKVFTCDIRAGKRGGRA